MNKHDHGIPASNGRHPGGRPPIVLQPGWCQQLIDHLARGNSFESFAGVISVAKQTLYSLMKRYPEFLDARDVGKEACRYWLEMVGIYGMLGIKKCKMRGPNGKEVEVELGKFQPSIWRLNMMCRFPEEWGSKSQMPYDVMGIEDIRDRVETGTKTA